MPWSGASTKAPGSFTLLDHFLLLLFKGLGSVVNGERVALTSLGIDKGPRGQIARESPASIETAVQVFFNSSPVSKQSLLSKLYFSLYDFMHQFSTWYWGVSRLFLVWSHPTRLGVTTTAATLALFSRPLCTSSNSCPPPSFVPTTRQLLYDPVALHVMRTRGINLETFKYNMHIYIICIYIYTYISNNTINHLSHLCFLFSK